MPGTQARKVERLEARVTQEQKHLFERAAALSGTTLTDFVVAKAYQAAAEVVRDAKELRLRDRDSAAFVDVLLNPPPPNAAARAAARRYNARAAR